ncbi:uncharacterized protein [Centruroides vittatus]|uniref:uncharacterized protein n=1 Tax=Centruroides vittatus TaxID=120091 RepID=UPI00350F5C9D
MSVKEKQQRILSLFEHLTAQVEHQLAPEDRDPRLSGIGILKRGSLFSCFHIKHLDEATKLYEILYHAKDFDDFFLLAKQAHSFVNEGLFVYAVSVALLHRDDCKGVTVPPIQEVFPDRFVPAETVNLAIKEANNNPNSDVVVEYEETGNILDPEYKLAYFREDIGTNAHHWHWHIVYPATWKEGVMKKSKDRKGELFYYMHQQMCARYDCERLSNGLNRMIPFHNFDEKLEGYAPHLTSLISGLQYGSRPRGFSLRDLKDVDVQDMERWRERILDAIHLGHIHTSEDEEIPLDEAHGADILGDIIESSAESRNPEFYGSLHNWGHVLMARIHDPDGRFNENPGVMSDTSTSLRDPIFYRWHRFVDNIFQDYKATLPTYSREQLDFPGVEVTEVTVNAKTKNVVHTFMKEEELELSHGIQFASDHSVKVKYHHLDHEPFSYTIEVNNTGKATKAAVRIFLGPKFDELGNVLDINEQRRLCIELDKFFVPLTPGKNKISRNAIESSVTVSELHTFDQLKKGEGVSETATEFCSCGWPEHMLIPRGNHRGMIFDLFVMLTDGNEDLVGLGGHCMDAVSYCGAKDALYPDKRPMGFPFDRPIDARNLQEFLTPNIHLTEVEIKFDGYVVWGASGRSSWVVAFTSLTGPSGKVMGVQDKQKRILPLFEHLTSLTTEQLPIDARDDRLKDVGHLERGKLFSCFHTDHLAEAESLYTVLFQAKDFDDFIHLCEQARNVVNEGLFVFAVSVAILHREDCKGVTVPPIQEIFPDRFVPAETINQALKADRKRAGDEDVVVKIQETGNILDPEYHLAYFREDIEVNAHHWHWHLVYPANWKPEVMGKVKDRKGELFYYMHQQMCARYDCDRLSTGLRRMIPFQNFDETLEGYSPHLTSLISGLNYASRPAGLSMHDVTDVNVQEMVRWRERVLDAIHVGHVIDDHGHEIPLDEEHGIDILGSLLESSAESKNKGYYGTLHNWGHVILARVHDPDGRFRENPGVMSDTSTSLRDPIFYRFHRFMDNMFQEYKAHLPSYDEHDLDFPGVIVEHVTVNAKVPDVITTTMKEDELQLSHGIKTKGSVKVQFEHLDHEPFTYSIDVQNKTGAVKHATVRIFLAPKYDELGNRMTLNDQRGLYIELDKFHKELPPGKSHITRDASSSSVTITHVPTFDELIQGKGVSEDNTEFCSCGWPSHMLLPRGNERGMVFQLFVMLTDYEKDNVGGINDHAICSDAVSYCGAKDSKYPDKKAMGFPFDRVIKARTPSQFATPNMSFTDIRIQHVEHDHVH